MTDAAVAVIFKETADKRVELSIRAKNGLDISTVAVALGGGGHKVAAGATTMAP
ncbi:MAG: DHHA1 domain-containing protein [Anaerolineae bacterium]